MVDPIEPVLKTSKSNARTIYSVSGNSTTTFAAPIGTASVTVYFGDTSIASDDSTYPWTLDSAGNVVFTSRSPRDGQIITIVANDLGLDLNKVNFPKGYFLDSRVFNRTLNSALYTVNEFWSTGSDLYDAWRSLNGFPSPTTLDNQLAVTNNRVWERQNATQVANTLEDGLFGNIIATGGVSAFDFSATTAVIGTLDTVSAILPSSTEGPFTYSRLDMNPDEVGVSGVIESGCTSGLILDASSSIISFDKDGDKINPSGLWLKTAANYIDAGADISQLTDYILTDDNNILVSPNVYGPGSKISSWVRTTSTQERNHVDSISFPQTCLRVSGSVVLDLDRWAALPSIPGVDLQAVYFRFLFDPAFPHWNPNAANNNITIGQTITKPTVPTDSRTPSIESVNFFIGYQGPGWDGTTPRDLPNSTKILFEPLLLIKFANSLVSNEKYITGDGFDLIHNVYQPKGTITLKAVDSTGASTKYVESLDRCFHLIGDITNTFYEGIADNFFGQPYGAGYSQPWEYLPLTIQQEIALGQPTCSHAIISLDPNFALDYYFQKRPAANVLDRLEYEIEFVLYPNYGDLHE